jgi:hypothetical protein
MFLTQIWGTVFGAFINYVVMISIVNQHRDLLLNSNGTYAWSGAYFQSLNNQATTWALSADLYSAGSRYILVPVGLALGFIIVFLHRVVVHVSHVSPITLIDSSSHSSEALISATSIYPLSLSTQVSSDSSKPRPRPYRASSVPDSSFSTISEITGREYSGITRTSSRLLWMVGVYCVSSSCHSQYLALLARRTHSRIGGAMPKDIPIIALRKGSMAECQLNNKTFGTLPLMQKMHPILVM